MIILLIFGVSVYLGIGLLIGRLTALTIQRRQWGSEYTRDETMQVWAHIALLFWPAILVGVAACGILYGTWSITQRIMIP